MLKTISEVKETGWNALLERLGVAEATLFVLEYEKDYGNYTEERKQRVKLGTLPYFLKFYYVSTPFLGRPLIPIR